MSKRLVGGVIGCKYKTFSWHWVNVVDSHIQRVILVTEKTTVTQVILLPSGNPFKCHEEVWSLQPIIPPRRFDIFFPLTGGCS